MIDVALILIAYGAGLGVGYVWGQRNTERRTRIDGPVRPPEAP